MKNKLIEISKKHLDKLLHYIVGGLIYFVVSILIVLFSNGKYTDSIIALVALLLVTLIAFINEIYDKYRKGGTGFNMWDIVATVIGGLLPFLFIIIQA